MLIRFSVENFRSFRERNVFSLEMVGSKKFSDTNAFHCEGLSPKEKLLKSAIIYGANACLLYTSPSPRDRQKSRMPSSA